MLTGPVHVHVWSTRTMLPAGGGRGGGAGGGRRWRRGRWRRWWRRRGGGGGTVATPRWAGRSATSCPIEQAGRPATSAWRAPLEPCCMRSDIAGFRARGRGGPTRRDVEADGPSGRDGVGPRAAVPEESDHERRRDANHHRGGEDPGDVPARGAARGFDRLAGIDAPVGEDAPDGARLGRQAPGHGAGLGCCRDAEEDRLRQGEPVRASARVAPQRRPPAGTVDAGVRARSDRQRCDEHIAGRDVGRRAEREDTGRREAASAGPDCSRRALGGGVGRACASGDSGDEQGARERHSERDAGGTRSVHVDVRLERLPQWVGWRAKLQFPLAGVRRGIVRRAVCRVGVGRCGQEPTLQRGSVRGSTWFPVFTGLSAVSLIRMSWNRPAQTSDSRAPERTDVPTIRVEAAPPPRTHARTRRRRQAAGRRVDEELPVRVRAAADLEVAERDPLAAHRLDAVLVGAGAVVVAADVAAVDRQVVGDGLGRVDLDTVDEPTSPPRSGGCRRCSSCAGGSRPRASFAS